jgi:gamma-carbonic anhydrase
VALIQPFLGVRPVFGDGVFLAENATVIGDVTIGKDSSIWHGAVLRGDVGKIRIGERTNIQDLCCVHMTLHVSDSILGDEVTVGHNVVIHGAVIEDGALIGMGAIVMDNARIGAESLIAAGSLITSNFVVPPRTLVRGSPAKVIRDLTDEEASQGRVSAARYLEYVKQHRQSGA